MGTLNSVESIRRGVPEKLLAPYNVAFSSKEIKIPPRTAAAAGVSPGNENNRKGEDEKTFTIDGRFHIVPTLFLHERNNEAASGTLSAEQLSRWQQLTSYLVDMRHQPQTALMYLNRDNSEQNVPQTAEKALGTWVRRRDTYNTDAELFGEEGNRSSNSNNSSSSSGGGGRAIHAQPHSSMIFIEVLQRHQDQSLSAPPQELIDFLRLIPFDLPAGCNNVSGSRRQRDDAESSPSAAAASTRHIFGVPLCYHGAGRSDVPGNWQLGLYKNHAGFAAEVPVTGAIKCAMRVFALQLREIGADLRQSIVCPVDFTTNQNNADVLRIVCDTLTLLCSMDEKRRRGTAAATTAASSGDGTEQRQPPPLLRRGDLRVQLIDNGRAFQFILDPNLTISLLALVTQDLERKAAGAEVTRTTVVPNQPANMPTQKFIFAPSQQASAAVSSSSSNRSIMPSSLFSSSSLTGNAMPSENTAAAAPSAGSGYSGLHIHNDHVLDPSASFPFREEPSPAALRGADGAPLPVFFGFDRAIDMKPICYGGQQEDDDPEQAETSEQERHRIARSAMCRTLWSKALITCLRSDARRIVERCWIQEESAASGDNTTSTTATIIPINMQELRSVSSTSDFILNFLQMKQENQKHKTMKLIFALRVSAPRTAIVELSPLFCCENRHGGDNDAAGAVMSTTDVRRILWEVNVFRRNNINNNSGGSNDVDRTLVWQQKFPYLAKGERRSQNTSSAATSAAAPLPGAASAAPAGLYGIFFPPGASVHAAQQSLVMRK